MHRLAHPHSLARRLVRWVLLCFALSLTAAIASPLVRPQAMELVCSSAGSVKLVMKSADGGQAAAGHLLDCPLCVALNAPPPPNLSLRAEPAQPLAHVLRSIPSAHIAALTAAPPPGRGPPVVS
ncbi:MAG: hypothetical protein JWP29_3260 [Rhodoferax sp.]|nr:hypothetical protein [Rhodoferax sp.]